VVVRNPGTQSEERRDTRAINSPDMATAHQLRNDARRVELLLIPNRIAGAGPIHGESDWSLENSGEGTAVSPRILLRFDHGSNHHSFSAHVPGSVHGKTQVPINFDRRTPMPTQTIEGTGDSVRQHLSAVVTYGTPGKRRVIKRSLTIAATTT
jgi:hypothetical protein